jgi:pentatricopeptide repeat protein
MLADEAEKLSLQGRHFDVVSIWNQLCLPHGSGKTGSGAGISHSSSPPCSVDVSVEEAGEVGRLCTATMRSKLAVGDHRGALFCWEGGLRLGWHPDAGAYALALQACTSVKRQWRWKRALSLLKEMEQSGVERDTEHYHCAITACSQAKQLPSVSSLLQEMGKLDIQPEPKTITVALACCKPGRAGAMAALALLESVKRQGASVSAAGYNNVLALCAGSGIWEPALAILKDMSPTAQHYDFAIRACASARPIRWREALALLRAENYTPSAKTCTTVIAALEASHQRRKAVSLLQEVLASAPRDRVAHYNLLIDASAKARHWQNAAALFEEMKGRKGLDADTITHNSLINAYARCGRVTEALSAFDAMRASARRGEGPQPDVVTFSTAIHACGLAGDAHRAMALLREMAAAGVPPSSRTYGSCIVACEKAGLALDAIRLFDEMRMDGLLPDRLAFNSAISAAGHLGRSQRALALLEELEGGLGADRYSFNSAMSACIRGRLWADVLSIVERMKAATVEPDKITYTNLVKCQAELRQWRGALDVLTEMRARGVNGDVICYNAAISACAKCGRPAEAEQLLADMKLAKIVPDAYTYNSLISAYAQAANWKKAIVTLETMREKKMRTSVLSYSTAMYACERGLQWERALELLMRMESEGLLPGTYAYNIAASACAKCGKTDRALLVLEEMRSKGLEMDTMSYGISMFTHGRVGAWAACLELLREMRARSVRRDWYSYHNTLVALGKAQQYQTAVNIFESMKADGVKPDLSCFNTMMRMCERGGMWQEALQYLSDMTSHGVQPIAFHLKCAAGACAAAGREDAIRPLLQRGKDAGLIPSDGGTYFDRALVRAACGPPSRF